LDKRAPAGFNCVPSIVNCYGHVVEGGKEKRNITVLAHLVFDNFHPTHKGTQHRSLNVLFRTTQFVNIILYLETIAIDWNGGLPIENTKKRMGH